MRSSLAPARLLAILLLAGLLSVAALGVSGLAPATASASACVREGRYHYDPDWQRLRPGWICGNTPHTGMYLNATFQSFPVAIMDSSRSWFVCWGYGDYHMGGNNIWYRSQGDRFWGNYPWSDRWGWIPASNVYTSIDPQPGMERC